MFHPDLMVFGVIGWLLITERLELMEKFLVTGKIGISRMVVALLFSGVFSASLGILLGNEAIRFVGLSLLIAAFLYNLKRIMSSEGVKTAHDSNREVTGHRRRMSRIQGPHAISMSGMSCTSVYNDLPLKM